MTLQEPG